MIIKGVELDNKFTGAIIVHQFNKRRFLGQDLSYGFSGDLVGTYEAEIEQLGKISFTKEIMTSFYVNQLEIKKAEVQVLLEASKDPNISKELKLELLERALKIYDGLSEV